MLCVEQSPLAPSHVYRSIRSKLRYDTEHEKGWSEYITNVRPIQKIESSSAYSTAGRITTTSKEILDDVDVSLFPLFQPCFQLKITGNHICYRIRDSL